jgi:hypothetical protein
MAVALDEGSPFARVPPPPPGAQWAPPPSYADSGDWARARALDEGSAFRVPPTPLIAAPPVFAASEEAIVVAALEEPVFVSAPAIATIMAPTFAPEDSPVSFEFGDDAGLAGPRIAPLIAAPPVFAATEELATVVAVESDAAFIPLVLVPWPASPPYADSGDWGGASARAFDEGSPFPLPPPPTPPAPPVPFAAGEELWFFSPPPPSAIDTYSLFALATIDLFVTLAPTPDLILERAPTPDLVLEPAQLSIGSPISPASLSPKVWLRSDLGIALDGSGNVQSWADQSGNGYNVSRAFPTQRPAYSASGGPNGVPELTWPALGNDILLQLASYPDALLKDVFIVATPASIPSSAPYGYMIDFGGNISELITYPGSIVAAYSGVLLGGPPIVSGTPFVLEEQLTSPGGVATLIVDGAASTSGFIGTAVGGSLTIGNYAGGLNGFSGSIFEVLVFPVILTAAQRTGLLTYFQARYGINTGNPLVSVPSDLILEPSAAPDLILEPPISPDNILIE